MTGLDYYQGLCFPIFLSVSLPGHQQNETKQTSKRKIYTSKILAFACWTDNIQILAIVMLGFPGKGIHCEGMEQIKRKIPFNRNKEAVKSPSFCLSQLTVVSEQALQQMFQQM